MRCVIAIGLVAGCWRAETPAPRPVVVDRDPVPAIRFAVLDDSVGRILAVAPGNSQLVVEREFAVPAFSSGFVWAGPSALALAHVFDGVSVIETLGERELEVAPSIAWPAVAGPADTISSDESRVFTSGRQAALVLARCAWRAPDGFEWRGECTTWQYARLWPAPVAVLDDAPVEDPSPLPIPKLAPTKPTTVFDKENRELVHCRDARGHARDLWPPEMGAVELDWLVADPPIFRLDTTSGSGMGPGYVRHRIFEGCARSRRYANAFVGPRGEVVLVGHRIAVYWHGTLVAHHTGRAPLEVAPEDDVEERSRVDAEDDDGFEHPMLVAFAPP